MRVVTLWFFVGPDDVGLEGALLLSEDVVPLLLLLQSGQFSLFFTQQLPSAQLDGDVSSSFLLLFVEDALGLEGSSIHFVLLRSLWLILFVLLIAL